MKKQSYHTQVFAGALILALGLLPAAALARDNEGSVSGIITSHTGVQGGEVSTETDIQAGASVGAQNDGDRSEGVSGSERHQGDENVSDDDADEIEIDQDSADNASSTIDAPEHVTNRGELRSFLNHIVKADEHIADVHISTSTIETHYALPAKFLWAIPASLTADVAIQSDGSVTITYPWYAFLFAKHDSELAAQLHSVASAGASASTTLSASERAHLLDLLFSTLKNAQ